MRCLSYIPSQCTVEALGPCTRDTLCPVSHIPYPTLPAPHPPRLLQAGARDDLAGLPGCGLSEDERRKAPTPYTRCGRKALHARVFLGSVRRQAIN